MGLVVAEPVRVALLRRASLAVARSIDDATHLTVTVAPADAPSANRLFGELAREASPPLNLEVVVDDALDEGTCVCEWDYGVVESSLRAQLASLERALANGAALTAAKEAPEDEAPEDDWQSDDSYDSHDDRAGATRADRYEDIDSDGARI